MNTPSKIESQHCTTNRGVLSSDLKKKVLNRLPTEYKLCNTPEQEAQKMWDNRQPAHSNVRRYIGSGEDVMLEML